MSGGIFGRVFGPCFRGWLQPIDQNTNRNKYIDYAPNRKWKYDDKNLIKELTKDQANSWDVMDLNEDDDYDGKIALTSKLQLHDNVFINPLDDVDDNESENDDGNNNKRKEEEINTDHIEIIEPSISQASGETTEKTVESAGETTEKTVESAGEATERTVESAGETTEKTVESAGETTEKTVESAGESTVESVHSEEPYDKDTVEYNLQQGRGDTAINETVLQDDVEDVEDGAKLVE